MKTCPCCQGSLAIPTNAIRNMEAHQTSIIVNTLCCGNTIRATPHFDYAVSEYKGTANLDDWGAKVKKVTA